MEALSAKFENLNKDALVVLVRDSALDMAVYGLVIAAGKNYMLGVGALLACKHYRLQDGNGSTNYRPINAARQVAAAALMGYAGTFLYQGFKAIPNQSALQPLGTGIACWVGAHVVRNYADKAVS